MRLRRNFREGVFRREQQDPSRMFLQGWAIASPRWRKVRFERIGPSFWDLVWFWFYGRVISWHARLRKPNGWVWNLLFITCFWKGFYWLILSRETYRKLLRNIGFGWIDWRGLRKLRIQLGLDSQLKKSSIPRRIKWRRKGWIWDLQVPWWKVIWGVLEIW